MKKNSLKLGIALLLTVGSAGSAWGQTSGTSVTAATFDQSKWDLQPSFFIISDSTYFKFSPMNIADISAGADLSCIATGPLSGGLWTSYCNPAGKIGSSRAFPNAITSEGSTYQGTRFVVRGTKFTKMDLASNTFDGCGDLTSTWSGAPLVGGVHPADNITAMVTEQGGDQRLVISRDRYWEVEIGSSQSSCSGPGEIYQGGNCWINEGYLASHADFVNAPAATTDGLKPFEGEGVTAMLEYGGDWLVFSGEKVWSYDPYWRSWNFLGTFADITSGC